MFNKSSNYTIFFTLPLLMYLWYTFYMHIDSDLYMSAIDIVDFFIHEFWHLLFSIFGNEFTSVLWWTILQVIIPLILLFYFYSQKDYFANALSFSWLGTNFFYISTYSWDAVMMNLPLIWMWWWEIIHDWFYIFKKIWVLNHTNLISDWFYYLAIILFLFSFIYSFSLIINRIKDWKI